MASLTYLSLGIKVGGDRPTGTTPLLE